MRENMGRFRGRTFVCDEWETQWYYGYLYVDSWKEIPLYEIYMPRTDERHIQPEWYCVDPETVGECTGLKDCNGKMIYEGDLLRTKKYGVCIGRSNVNGYDTFFVVYRPGGFRLERNNPDRGFNLTDSTELEIIGNIHDNPELIGGDGK